MHWKLFVVERVLDMIYSTATCRWVRWFAAEWYQRVVEGAECSPKPDQTADLEVWFVLNPCSGIPWLNSQKILGIGA